MKSLKFLLLALLCSGNFSISMESPESSKSPSPVPDTFNQVKANVIQAMERLKKALTDKEDPAIIQKIIDEINARAKEISKYPQQTRYLWNEIIAKQKAFILGTAQSTYRVIDIFVQNLTANNKPVFDSVKKQHLNAQINLNLIIEFLAPLERR